jgi:hypothetical protein
MRTKSAWALMIPVLIAQVLASHAMAVERSRAGVPDSSMCLVDPWDEWGKAFVSPGTQSGVDTVRIVVADGAGTPLPGVLVEIHFDGCSTLCADTPDGLAGVTGAGGEVTLDPRVGGCAGCSATIVAGGVSIRTYAQVASPDWDGFAANGQVLLPDAAFFYARVGMSDLCADYDGDGLVDQDDIDLFAAAYNARDANARPCMEPPDPDQSSVLPWDDYGKAFVSPGTQSGVDSVSIAVRDFFGRPLSGAFVEIAFDGCNSLCVDAPDGLSGITGGDGRVVLDPRVGGCAGCVATVFADGVPLRTYARVASPDWDGSAADGQMHLADAVFFYGRVGTSDPCADYTGDGVVDQDDIDLFSAAYDAQDANDWHCGEPPDPGQCSVQPWDDYGKAFVSPGTQSGVDSVRVVLADVLGRRLPGVPVQIIFQDCATLCSDSPDGLSGATDADGELVLDPRVGGCAGCQAVVLAGGVPIRTYAQVASPDWSGFVADGQVLLADVTFFYSRMGTSDPCADYTGDGIVDQDDDDLFSAAYNARDANSQCIPLPSAAQSTVSPWDGYGKAFVSPGVQSRVDRVTITVKDAAGDPMPGARVAIDISACASLCIDTPDGLSGVTDLLGNVTLDPRAGGCETCPVIVRANGMAVRSYSQVVSPDWNGYFADGLMSWPDSAFFLAAYDAGDPCADYDGGGVGLTDLQLFLAAYRRDANLVPCLEAGVEEEHAVADAPRANGPILAPVPFLRGGPCLLAFDLPEAGRVSLKVFDVCGAVVAVVAEGRFPAGRNEVSWDGRGKTGLLLPRGVYFLSLAAGGGRATERMVLIR